MDPETEDRPLVAEESESDISWRSFLSRRWITFLTKMMIIGKIDPIAWSWASATSKTALTSTFCKVLSGKGLFLHVLRKVVIEPTSLQGHLDSVHLLHPEPSKPTSWWAQNPPRLPSGDLWWRLQQSFSTQVTLQSHQVVQSPGDPVQW